MKGSIDRRTGSALGGALLVLLALACASDAPPLPAASESAERSEYVIGTGDMLSIRVWKNPELSVQVPVRTDGKISVPLVNNVQAEGLTTTELQQVITRQLEEYISNPDVTVLVNQMTSKRAYVLGEVRRSGPLSLSTDMRVLDAISASGGFTPFADKDDIQIIRRSEDGDERYVFDYDAYVSGEAPGTNLLLQPGDTIVVSD